MLSASFQNCELLFDISCFLALTLLAGVLEVGIYSNRSVLTFVLCAQRNMGAQWLSGRVLDLRPRGCGFEPHWRHCVVSLSQAHLS